MGPCSQDLIAPSNEPTYQFNFAGEGKLQNMNTSSDYLNGYMVALNDIVAKLKSGALAMN